MTTPAETQGWIATDETFGARLALVRQRMGWNIAEAARECGVGAENWRLWEQAGRTPSRLVTIALGIANRTGCDYLWLVHGPERGATIRRTAYIGQTVVAAAGAPRQGRPNPNRTGRSHTRPVHQTRPTGRPVVRPRTPEPV